MFYPNYVNGGRTLAQGRKIPTKHCCKDPTTLELAHIASALKLPYFIERYKLHPRSFKLKPRQMMFPGRIRVKLWDDPETKKKPINEKIPDRKAFMIFAGENIPKLKIRHQREAQALAHAQAQKAAMEKQMQKKTKKQKGKRKKKGKR